MTPKEAAIRLVKVYVLRGDDMKSLQQSCLGCYCDEFHASIKSDEIIVSEIMGKPCLHIFKLRQIYDEILKGEQMELLQA